MIDFIIDRPAAYIDDLDSIVVSDLHLGVEREYEQRGVVIKGHDGILRDILRVVEETGAKNMVIIGDIKHAINPSLEDVENIRGFFKVVSERVNVILVKGNHDGGIERILKTNAFGARGVRMGKFYFNHGHTWPGRDLDGAEYLLMGHLHPEVRMVVPGSHRKYHRCWLIGEATEKMLEYYDFHGKVVVFPAFNSLVGMSIKEYAPGPLFRNSLISLDDMDVYLLDSTHLGKFSNLVEKGKIYYHY